VQASPGDLFDFLDDFRRLGAHMEKSSALMLGARMDYDFDDAMGRAIGSSVRMRGNTSRKTYW
jgi:hypothetical protein